MLCYTERGLVLTVVIYKIILLAAGTLIYFPVPIFCPLNGRLSVVLVRVIWVVRPLQCLVPIFRVCLVSLPVSLFGLVAEVLVLLIALLKSPKYFVLIFLLVGFHH